MNRQATHSGSPQEIAAHPPVRRRTRVPWLDVFRGAAVLVMIETHVLNTFLAAGFRATEWFALLNYINGLVAPSFLFIAGFVQGMERRLSPGKPIDYARRARRLLGVGAIGYALHFPIGELLQARWGDALRIGSQIDVLQCLAAGLGLLLGVQYLAERWRSPVETRTPGTDSGESRVWVIGVVALAAGLVLAAPAVQDWRGGPVALRAWVNFSTGSLFPIFPWVGFVLFGALMGAWPERPLAERAAGLVGLAVLAWACRGTSFTAFSPAFFLERAVWVLALAAFCEWTSTRSLPPLLVFAGKHSLKLYVIHLVLITTLVGFGLPMAGLDLPSTLAWLLGVGVTSVGLTWLLNLVPGFRPVRRPADSVAAPVPILPATDPAA